MESLWLILGIVVLAATLIDVFLTALNYDESGFFTDRVAAAQWRLLRRITRRMPRRWRPNALRQVTGLQVVVTILVWVCGTIVGYGLIYRSQMTPSSFSASGGEDQLNLFDALYFSAAQLATVGGSVLTAETDPLRFLSIVEALNGVVLLSLTLTYLLGVYDVIGSLNNLCRQFSPTERGAGSAVATLAPYFHDGQADGLDSHLDEISDALTAYMDGLRMHHAAYYFQSGRDQFALPYALRMVGDTLSAVRWGLPTGHPATAQPSLGPLIFQFVEFVDALQARLRWRDLDVPEVVSKDVFVAHAGVGALDSPRDPWVMAFLVLESQMSRLAGVRPLADLDDAHQRYAQWLPFAYRVKQVTLAVSKDLDYQPLIVAASPVSVLRERNPVVLRGVEEFPESSPEPSPIPAGTPATHSASGPADGWRQFVDRTRAVDPGRLRLRSATRALVAASGAVATLYLIIDALDHEALPAAVFGGFCAMLSLTASATPGVRSRAQASLLVGVPLILAVLLGASTSQIPVVREVLMVAIAFVGVGARAFGPMWSTLGKIGFLAFYFAVILKLELADAPWFATAALVGVVWAVACTHLLLPDKPTRLLMQGVDAMIEEMTRTVGTLVDAVSWARWDPDIRRRVAVDVRRIHRTGAFVTGQAQQAFTEETVIRSAEALRFRVFETELAMVNLKNSVRSVTGTALSLEARGRLAGMLELLRADLAERPQSGTDDHHRLREQMSQSWPPAARRLVRAIDEFERAVWSLSRWQADPTLIEPLDPDDPDADAALAALAMPGKKEASASGGAQLHLRRAVQAAVAIGAALVVGASVSASQQYWATLAAFQTLGETDGETLDRGVRRIVGAVCGAALGFAIAIGTGGRPEAMIPVLAVALFGSVYYRPVSRSGTIFWTTLIFAGIYEFLGKLTTVAVEHRIVETFLGALAAVVVAWWVFPTHTKDKVNQDIAGLTREVQVVTAGSLERLSGSGEISRGAVQQRLLALDQQIRSLNSDAAPIRRTVGALGTGGVETLLTTVWSLVFATRRLARAVERSQADGAGTAGVDWISVRAQIDANLSAVLAATSGLVPSEVADDLDPLDGDGQVSPAALDIFAQAQRLNQTVLALLDELSPRASDH